MLDKNPDTRATVEELLETDWVTNSGHESVNVDMVDKIQEQLVNNRIQAFHKRYANSFSLTQQFEQKVANNV